MTKWSRQTLAVVGYGDVTCLLMSSTEKRIVSIRWHFRQNSSPGLDMRKHWTDSGWGTSWRMINLNSLEMSTSWRREKTKKPTKTKRQETQQLKVTWLLEQEAERDGRMVGQMGTGSGDRTGSVILTLTSWFTWLDCAYGGERSWFLLQVFCCCCCF